MTSSPAGPEDRLDSWKEIAGYLKRGVRTVQRWEQSNDLPVHRLDLDRRGVVYAYKQEIDAWWASRSLAGLEEPAPAQEALPEFPPTAPAAEPPIRWRGPVAIASGVLLVAALALIAASRFSQPGIALPLDPQPLTSDAGNELAPSFSPDGERVAYCASPGDDQNWRIYVKTIATAAVTALTDGKTSDVVPSWSPDGVTIAFEREQRQTEARQIVLMPASGEKTERVLATLKSGPEALAWSPDNQWLVTSQGSRKQHNLIALNIKTGAQRTLTSPDTSPAAKPIHDFSAAISPDGSTLVFTRAADEESLALYRMGLTRDFRPSGPPTLLTDLNHDTRQPAFLPDGRSIVFISGSKLDGTSLWQLRLDRWPFERQPEPTLLYRPDGACGFPDLSRRGHRLVFSLERRSRISVWRQDLTPDLQPLGQPSKLIASTRTDYNATYSPDGRRIAFHSLRSGNSEIWTCDADGTNAVQLTNLKAPITGAPRWSPDGNWIVFDSDSIGQFEVYRIHATGGEPERLTFSPGIDGVPSYSHDGQWIYFVSERSGSYQVWKMSSDGRNPRQITRKGGYLPWESEEGRYIYYSVVRGTGPINRVPVDGGLEEQVLPMADEFHFFPVRDGIFFSNRARGIEFLSTATGKISTFLKTQEPLRIGLTLSSDHRHMLFSQAELESSDLMLVNDFGGKR